MAYIPDPTNINQPTSDVKAGTADDEFRALKAYVQGLVLGAVSQGPTVRQTALIGSQDANGGPNFLSAGAGLAVNLAALDAPLALTYAAGSGAAGDINYSEAIGADVVGVVSGLQPSNLNYITKLHNGAWGSTLAPVQYGKVFDKTAQMLMRWPGINNAVTSTEDFGNTLTFAGNAKLSTATQILGLNTLACDGTGDYVTTPFTSFGNGSWEIFGSFRTASLAVLQCLLNAGNAANYGVGLFITAAGVFNAYISSDGTSFNIANGFAGTTVIALNTTYYYRIVFDSVAGTYRVYLSNDGAAEVQEMTIASTAKVCATTVFSAGATNAGSSGFNGNLGFTGFRRFASFTSAQATGPTVAPTFLAVRQDFFSIPQMKMYEVTAASTVSGTSPALTAINKLYLGEATTGVATVSSVVNYAFKGQYYGPFVTPIPVAATGISQNHNLGVTPAYSDLQLENMTSELGYPVGALLSHASLYTADASGRLPLAVGKSRLNTYTVTGASATIAVEAQTSGVGSSITAAKWKYRFVANRGW